jgi:tripartite-type tricarboxylate transporter receptor subunit TctC
MKLPHRRQFLHLAAGAAALPAVPRIARAQTYQTRPVRIIVGFGPGGVTDIVARIMAQWLSERLGQPFVVENRPGAGTNLATSTVVRAPPDGYTLLITTSSNFVNTTLFDKLAFDFINDIAPVATIQRTPAVMEVNLDVPAKTVLEFIAYAKANPGKINMGAVGLGSITHVHGELFKIMAGVDLVTVQYSNPAPAYIDLMRGQIQVMFDAVVSSIENIKAGKLRPLAVTTASRLEVLPNVPTVGDFVPGYEASGFTGIGAPKNTPPAIVQMLNREINAGLADPKVKARLTELGGIPVTSTPAEFAKIIADETEKWGKVIRAANIKPE